MPQLLNTRLDKHIVWDSQATNNEQFAIYNKIEIWFCDECGRWANAKYI